MKNNVSLEQVLKQGEIDAIGISFSGRKRELYAVDIAFHELGLRYGSKEETAIRVVKKCVRSAMCLYGYMDYKNAKIIFSSPKINKTPNDLINKYINDAQNLMNRLGYKFTFEVIANDDFETKILDPVLNVSNDVADTSEMFLRSYQLVQMFK